MREPKRDGSWEHLTEPFKTKIHKLFNAMRARGFDPVIFEGLRTQERQKWLYDIGRTHHKNRKPVTWTLHSEHFTGEAADVINRKDWWSNETFYQVMRAEARILGLYSLYPRESCHIQLEEP